MSSGDEIALVFIVALLALSIVQSIRSWKARKPSRASSAPISRRSRLPLP